MKYKKGDGMKKRPDRSNKVQRGESKPRDQHKEMQRGKIAVKKDERERGWEEKERHERV